MIKAQDIVVLVSLIGENSVSSYKKLSGRVHLSVSETHAAVKRLEEAGLVNSDRRLINRNVSEFLTHALRYMFPFMQSGFLAKGMPTSYAAPVAENNFASTGAVPVWSGSKGNVYGMAFEPIYPSATEVAIQDPVLYDRLALVDMLRGGRLRERIFAQNKLNDILK